MEQSSKFKRQTLSSSSGFFKDITTNSIRCFSTKKRIICLVKKWQRQKRSASKSKRITDGRESSKLQAIVQR